VSEPRERFNLRFPADLLTWLRAYARTKKKTVTQVLVDLVVELKEKSRA
jgi:hypothetical protein